MRRFGRAIVVGVLAVASALVAVQPAVADADTTPPQVQSLTVSRDRVPAAGGSVTVTAHIVDAGAGVVDAPTISFGGWYGDVHPRVALTRTSGTAQDGTWTVEYPFDPARPLGLPFARLSAVTDAAGNTTSAGMYPWLTVGFGRATPPTAGTTTQLPGRVLRIAWAAPEDDGGSAVTGYRVTMGTSTVATLDAAARFTDYSAAASGASEDLRFSVVAINGAGSSDPLAIGPVRAEGTPPGAVGSFVATPQDGGLRLSWTRPADTGGDGRLEYYLDVEPGDHDCMTNEYYDVNAYSLSCTVTGLRPHVLYTATIEVENSFGDSADTSVSARPSGALDGQLFASASAGLGTIDVSWGVYPGPLAIESWTITVTPLDGQPTVYRMPPDARTLHLADLAQGATYRVAFGGDGDGASLSPTDLGYVFTQRWIPPVTAVTDPSPVLAPVTRPPAPAAPSSPKPAAPSAVRGMRTAPAERHAVQVSWAPSTGSSVTAYEVRLLLHGKVVRPPSGSKVARWRIDTARRTARLTGLAPAKAYTLQVRARNTSGTGPWSTPVAVRTRR